ncbi:hypothetical protein C1N81_39480 [Streptomyces sp. SGAir0957]
MPLTPRQAQALTAVAADGATLATAARDLGITREQVASLLNGAYRRLDVAYLPRDEKRPAAIAVARRKGLIPPAEQEQAA